MRYAWEKSGKTAQTDRKSRENCGILNPYSKSCAAYEMNREGGRRLSSEVASSNGDKRQQQ